MTHDELQDNITDAQQRVLDIQNELNTFEPSDYLEEKQFDEFLDEIYDEVNVCGLEYYASYAFKEMDPVRYHCAYLDWCNDYDLGNIEEYKELEASLQEAEDELEDLLEIENELLTED